MMTPEQAKRTLESRYEAFLKAVRQDISAGRFPKNPEDYREFFQQHLKKSDSALHHHLENVQYRKGERRFLADIDHVIPSSVWVALTGFQMKHRSVLSNLKARDDVYNRRDDQQMINLILKEQREGKLTLVQKKMWVGMFLELKDQQIEGSPWVPMGFSRLSHWELNQLVADLHGRQASTGLPE